MRAVGYGLTAWCCLAILTACWWAWRNRHRCHDCEDHRDIIRELEAEADVEHDPCTRARLLDGLDRAKGWRHVHLMQAHPEWRDRVWTAAEWAANDTYLTEQQEAERDG